MRYLCRIGLVNRRGALGAIATAFADAGADILSLTVVEQTEKQVVEDFVLDVPDDVDPAALRAVCARVDGAELDTLRVHTGPGAEPDDPFGLVDRFAASPDEALSLLAHLTAPQFHADWALVVEQAATGVVVRAASGGSPWLRWSALPWLPLAAPSEVKYDHAWAPASWGEDVSLAAAPVGAPTIAVLVGRAGGPTFRGSELMRLAHLAELVHHLTSRR